MDGRTSPVEKITQRETGGRVRVDVAPRRRWVSRGVTCRRVRSRATPGCIVELRRGGETQRCRRTRGDGGVMLEAAGEQRHAAPRWVIARAPVVDPRRGDDGGLVAFEVRACPLRSGCAADAGLWETAQALTGAAPSWVAGGVPVVVEATVEEACGDAVYALPPGAWVRIVAGGDAPVSDGQRAALEAVRASGYTLVWDLSSARLRSGSPEQEPARSVVDAADVVACAAECASMAAVRRWTERSGVPLLVRGVNDAEQAGRASGVGADLWSGMFHQDAGAVDVRVPDGAGRGVALLRAAAAADDPDQGVAEIAAHIRADPELVWQFQVYAMRHTPPLRPPRTLEEAVALVGANHVRRFAALTAARMAQRPLAASLVADTVVRARACERLAALSETAAPWDGLRAGFLSLFGALIGVPTPEAAERIAAPERIRDAVVGGRGALGAVVDAAAAAEVGDVERAEKEAARVGVRIEQVVGEVAAARDWAAEQLRE